MQKFVKSSNLLNFLREEKNQKLSIGFVPTMGCLHQGHLSLVKRSKLENDITIVSIYVNPSQFNDKDDFTSYPTGLDADEKLLQKAECDILFLPESQEMYKDGFREVDLDLGNLNLILESNQRPGHFKGVVFIVNKLFNIIMPNKAYFGEKDFQQLLIVKQLAFKNFKKIEVISCETIRDKEGLALSSRNKKLSLKELQIAKKVFKLFSKANQNLSKSTVNQSKQYVNDFFSKNEEITLDYYEIINQSNFSIVNSLDKNGLYRSMIAYRIGKIRLLDNLSVKI